jgi:tRNA(Ile)-lysidine synthase TilS/MesJ
LIDGEFSQLLDQYKDRRYQVIMAFSGGKDSTYTLKMIREKYQASILAVTFNNGFISESSLQNISLVTDYLGVDSLIVKYPAPKLLDAFKFAEDGKIFPPISLERASAICNLCIMFIKNMIYYEAMIRSIPIICFGWTPGQVGTAKPLIKLNYRTVSKVFDNVKSAIVKELGTGYEKYFLSSKFMEENEERVPYLYYPFVKNSYNEAEIIEEIEKIGWKFPENTDGNSSNCLLNSYANQSHVERFGYNPYCFEISSMVRNGCMTRKEGAEKLEKIKNDDTFEAVKKIFQSN